MTSETVEYLPRLPFTACLSGMSGCGKTKFFFDLLMRWDELFDQPIRSILIIYGYFQDRYAELVAKYGDKIRLEAQLSGDMLSTEALGRPEDGVAVVVLDDVCHKYASSDLITDIFIGRSHHLNLVCLLVTQNIFASNSVAFRTAMRNCTCLFLFRQPRDKNIIRILGRQLFPEKNGSLALAEAYDSALNDYSVSHPDAPEFGWLMVDCSLHTPNHLRLRTGLFPEEPKVVYMVMNG